ncbi:hypothetical protein [Kitasatospora sp. NPDC001175]|uniref:hypothetical protein n=1 Tax=Kitasatospora sp. NPDC001175 TaxID=3157103 RepID=UPI003D01E244
MTTSIQAPVAQQRRRRTRTTTVSSRPALAVSTLLPNDIDLLPGTEHLRCPDCTTWCPITGAKGSTPKLVPHHTERAGTPGARRCSGSNRRVLLDLTIAEWQDRWADAAKETTSRRPTTVLKKVKAPQPVALHQLNPAPPTANSARAKYETHRSRCAGCTGREYCTDGGRLFATYLQLLGQEPERRAAQAHTEQEQRLAERQQAKQQLQRRKKQWGERVPAAHFNDMVRRVEVAAGHADTRRRVYGPDLPSEERNTREESRALAQTRTAKAIREASPLRRSAA